MSSTPDPSPPNAASEAMSGREVAQDWSKTRFRAAVLSLAIGVLMLAMKSAAYLLTGSTAILSDALESIVHVVATAFALFSVVLAARPPDPSHPYGHGKVEYFSAGFEGALIMLAGLVILYDASVKLVRGTQLSSLDVGALIIAGAGVINFFLGLYLIRVGRRTHSLTLEADGKHVLTDSYTSLAVLVGIALVLWTGWTPLDPLVGVGVALNILIAGGRLVYRAVRGLMDAADPEQLSRAVAALERARRPGWIDVHRLRMLRIGDANHIDLHLVVPRFWDVERTHDEQDAVSAALARALPGAVGLLAHLDPCVDEYCRFCDYEPCPIRAHANVEKPAWSLELATAPSGRFESTGSDG